MYHVFILLFDQFELLDALGPAEILGKAPEDFELHYASLNGGNVISAQKAILSTEIYHPTDEQCQILLIPGGAGTRQLVQNDAFISFLAKEIVRFDYVLSVCTGAALLAKTNILEGKHATTNKRAFGWVTSLNPHVRWVKKSRWSMDRAIYTSSGISAGMDMTLGFIKDVLGRERAVEIATRIEYQWQEDPTLDPFSELYEL